MIVLKLTEEQAKIASKACEFYARMRMGQFGEILLNSEVLKEMMSQNPDGFCDRRDQAMHHLFKAREYIYPELKGRGHSFGIAKFKDADRAFDIHQVIRHTMGDPRAPFSVYELPKCERTDDE